MTRCWPVAILLPVLAHAQYPMMDLTMADNGQGQLEFRVRPDGDFGEVFSALTFTVRWPQSAGIALDTSVLLHPGGDYIPVGAVHTLGESGGYYYRTFNGFGLSFVTDFAPALRAHREYPICTADILVPGTEFELVNDAWTDSNNRSYYCSLGGSDRTGSYFTSAEPTVDVRSFDPGTGNVNVFLTPHEDFFGWVTSLDFTLRWSASSGAHLGTPVQSADVAEYLTIEKVGGEVIDGEFVYQRFHGAGIQSIANSDDAWWANVDVLAAAIPILGSAPGLAIANDDWTGSHGGDFAITLNGQDHPGTVEGLATAMDTPSTGGDPITAVPSTGSLRIAADRTVTDEQVGLSLFAFTGQLMWQGTLPRSQNSITVNTSNWAEGAFILQARCGDRTITRRLVL